MCLHIPCKKVIYHNYAAEPSRLRQGGDSLLERYGKTLRTPARTSLMILNLAT